MSSCLACGKTGKLKRCARCKSAWFCGRECQVVAVKKQGHNGANCRPAVAVQAPAPAAKSSKAHMSTQSEKADLADRFGGLLVGGDAARTTNSRLGLRAAVEKYTEAASVADRMGEGELGAFCRAAANNKLSDTLLHLRDMPAAARAACSSLRAARASGSRSTLVTVLTTCAAAAKLAPDEVAKAERESREQERLGGSPPSHTRLDLEQEGQICLPTTPAALSRLCLAYNEAGVAICNSALAAAGGRGSLAAANNRRVPSLSVEANARGTLALCLDGPGDVQRSAELLRQAVALMRQVVQTTPPGPKAVEAREFLLGWLGNLGVKLTAIGEGYTRCAPGSDEMAGAVACLREALELSEETNDVALKQCVLTYLVNLPGSPGNQFAELTEVEVLRSRLNALSTSTGRIPDTSCTICLEPLDQPDGGAEQDAVCAGGREAAGVSAVRVLRCGHQFHLGCIMTWFDKRSDTVCPICKM